MWHHTSSHTCMHLQWWFQGCQLSRIDRETRAFHHILTLSRWYKNLSLIFFFFACQRFVMYEGYPYYVPAKSRQKFWGRKKLHCITNEVHKCDVIWTVCTKLHMMCLQELSDVCSVYSSFILFSVITNTSSLHTRDDTGTIPNFLNFTVSALTCW